MGVGQNVDTIGCIRVVGSNGAGASQRIEHHIAVIQQSELKGPEIGIVQPIPGTPQTDVNASVRIIRRVSPLKIEAQTDIG